MSVSYTHLDVYKRQAEDNAGNVSDAIFADFMFEQTEPVAAKTLTPDHWTNGAVEIDLSTCLLYTSRCV